MNKVNPAQVSNKIESKAINVDKSRSFSRMQISSVDHSSHNSNSFTTSLKNDATLSDLDDARLHFNKNSEKPINEDKKTEEVNLENRGNKSNFNKGKFAERYDVIRKNLFRVVRRYLWELFDKQFDVSVLPKINRQISTNKYVIELYDTRFRDYANEEDMDNNEANQKCEFIVSIIISNKHSYSNKIVTQRNFISHFESIFKDIQIKRMIGCLKFHMFAMFSRYSWTQDLLKIWFSRIQSFMNQERLISEWLVSLLITTAKA